MSNDNPLDELKCVLEQIKECTSEGFTDCYVDDALSWLEVAQRQAAPVAQPAPLTNQLIAACNYIDTLGGDSKAYRQAVAAQPAQQVEAAGQVPQELRDIGELLRTQNNRITDSPIFIVQQKRAYVAAEGYDHDRIEWRESENGDYVEASPLRHSRLEAIFDQTGNEPFGWKRFAMKDRWEFVTACFTEQGCKDYIASNGHNLNAPRIYAEGSYRNEEYRAVRKWLMSLNAAPQLEAQQAGDVALKAARYDWLRQDAMDRYVAIFIAPDTFDALTGEALDEAVDDLMAKEKA